MEVKTDILKKDAIFDSYNRWEIIVDSWKKIAVYHNCRSDTYQESKLREP